MFQDLGATVIDADKIAHGLISAGGACVEPVRKAFGDDVIADGAVDRPALANIVFADPKQRQELEAIIHPEVRRVISERIAQIYKEDPDRVIVIDIPLLFEARMEDLADMAVVVGCEEEQQLQRATESLKIARHGRFVKDSIADAVGREGRARRCRD